MKIVNKQARETADISSARGTTVSEFWKMVLAALVLLMGLYLVTGWVVDVVVSRISFETEARLFKSVTFMDSKIVPESQKKNFERARTILERLRTQEQAPELPYTLILIEDDRPNAFAFPGGTIGITSGLMEALDETVEIAFVLGHEMGHFYHRDHLNGLGRSLGFGILLNLVFGGGAGAQSFGDMAGFVLQRGYSQNRETKADRFGLQLVYQTYGKTKGVDHLFQILDKKEDLPQWAYMFSTHPAPKKRIRDLNRYSKALTGR